MTYFVSSFIDIAEEKRPLFFELERLTPNVSTDHFPEKCKLEAKETFDQMKNFKDENVSRHEATMQRVSGNFL